MDDPEKLRNLRVGDQERQSAQAALAEHLGAGRLDVDEYAHRVDSCLAARTRRELLALFDDLPPPLPDLAESTTGVMPDGSKSAPRAVSEDMKPALDALDVTQGLVLLLGIPAAAVTGYVYGAWWALAVPVTVMLALSIVEVIIKYRTRR